MKISFAGFYASLVFAFLSFPSSAQIPRTITFQGTLAGPSGTPMPDGSYTVTFRLFEAPNGGAAVWTEANKSITVSGGKGLFTTDLGAPTPFGALVFNRPLYLEVQVSGDAAMTPRRPLSSAPYALDPGGGGGSLTLPYAGAGTANDTNSVFKITNSGTGYNIHGVSPASIGVYGESTAWVGVWGRSGANEGVHGDSSTGTGVAGYSTKWVGTYGYSSESAGVWGRSGTGTGVFGQADGGGVGVFGVSEQFEGVRGESRSVNHGAIVAYNTTAGPAFYGRSLGGGYAGIFDGLTSVKVLEITGGSDLAERFLTDAPAQPGTVMAIDPKNPGSLCVAAGAYNRKVAGVVSGANGLGIGMVLPDPSNAKDAQPIAMSGRVWVRCTTANGSIEPGDLLTTSEKPGLAMKVTDHIRGPGATLGKAMTALDRDDGMVLALVNLQ